MKNTYLVVGSISVIVLSSVLIFGLLPVLNFLKYLATLVLTICMYWYLAVHAPITLYEKLYYAKNYERAPVWFACVSVWVFSYVGLNWYFGFVGMIVGDEKFSLLLTLIGPILSAIIAVVGILMSTIYALFGKDKKDQ